MCCHFTSDGIHSYRMAELVNSEHVTFPIDLYTETTGFHRVSDYSSSHTH